jgi:hypothetical protein
VVRLRGRRKRLCARVARAALLRGRSASPLEAMTGRSAVAIVAVIILLGLVWVLVPPFPAPADLIDKSPQALTMQLGSSHDVALAVPAPLRPWRTVAWEKSRGIAVWELQANWARAPADPLSPPDVISRCLRVSWAPAWADVVLPCEAVARGRVMASNNRWRGP